MVTTWWIKNPQYCEYFICWTSFLLAASETAKRKNNMRNFVMFVRRMRGILIVLWCRAVSNAVITARVSCRNSALQTCWLFFHSFSPLSAAVCVRRVISKGGSHIFARNGRLRCRVASSRVESTLMALWCAPKNDWLELICKWAVIPFYLLAYAVGSLRASASLTTTTTQLPSIPRPDRTAFYFYFIFLFSVELFELLKRSFHLPIRRGPFN